MCVDYILHAIDGRAFAMASNVLFIVYGAGSNLPPILLLHAIQFQKESTLAKWFEARTKNARTSRRKMIVALARKLLIALWHLVRDGVVPEGVVLRPAH